MSKKMSNKIMDKIKKEQIKPVPKWEFLLKDSLVWGAFALTILIGAIAVSISIFQIQTADWEFARHLSSSRPGFFFKNMPYFWIITFAAFIFLADYNYRHTKNGYKHSLTTVIIANLIISVVLGFALFGAGAARAIDKGLLEKVPPYAKVMHEQRLQAWANSNNLLAGQITQVSSNIIVVDFNNKEWTVILPEEFDKNLHEGMTIRSIGEKVSDDTFQAQRIEPWRGNIRPEDGLGRPPLQNMKESIRPPRIN
jgi:cellobiose-specific phosphotransferase system component IIC